MHSTATIVLKHLVLTLEGATAVNAHHGSRRAACSCRVFADVFPPDIFDRAAAFAMDAIRREVADDHIANHGIVLQAEQRRLTFRLAPAGQVIASVIAIKYFTHTQFNGGRQLHSFCGVRSRRAISDGCAGCRGRTR